MRRPLALILVPLALGAAACGDDAMSAEDYRAEAKQICVDSQKATEAVERPQRTTTAAIADYLQRLLETNERTTDRFAKLDPPEELQAAHDEVLKVNEDGAQEVRGIVEKLEADEDPAEVLEAATAPLEALNERSNAAAKKLGVRECEQ